MTQTLDEKMAEYNDDVDRWNELLAAAAAVIVTTPSMQVVCNGMAGFPVDGAALQRLAKAIDALEAAASSRDKSVSERP